MPHDLPYLTLPYLTLPYLTLPHRYCACLNELDRLNRAVQHAKRNKNSDPKDLGRIYFARPSDFLF